MRRTILIALLLVTGCGFFSKTKNTFYSLETLGPSAAVRAVTGAPVAIEAIELPPGIDRREIVARAADRKLEFKGNQQWAGPLEDMVIHTLAFDLAKRLPEGMVVLPGQVKAAASSPTRPIFVIFEDLAVGADRVFVLDARWTLAGRSTHERITVPVGSNDNAQVVAAMSQALAMLADRIVAAL